MFRMSVSTSTVAKGVDPTAVDVYDSGDDWEIGVGNLIIDLDADLEKDRQKFEMSNSTNSGCASKDSGHCLASSGPVNSTSSTLADSLKFATVQQASSSQGNNHKETSKSKVKRSKTLKDVNKSLPSPSLYGMPEISSNTGKRQQEAGRLGEVASSAGMNAALGHSTNGVGLTANATCGKNVKEERTGSKSQSTRGSKRDKDSGKPRKDNSNKLYDLGHSNTGVNNQAVVHLYGFGAGKAPGNGSPFHCGNSLAGELAKSTVDSGIMGNSVLGKKEEEDEESHRRNKKLKTEKVDPLFTVPAPPPPPVSNNIPTSPILPSYFSPSSTIAAPVEQLLVRTRSVGVNTCEVGVVTEPECLGPCEPGTSVNLEGIVWHETEEGVLVVNVTWRNKTYVGTLLDCTKHDWAPPRFCDSPTSDLEMRGGRGRGKRARSAATATAPGPVSDTNFTEVRGLQNKNRGGANGKGRRGSINTSGRRTPPNCAIEDIKASPSPAGKRKNRPSIELDLNSSSEDNKSGKRVRTNSRSMPTTPQGKNDSFLDQGCSSPVLIDCPHPNCNKKYKHINGLRYHQAHAHLDSDNKLDFEQDSEDKVSDCEEALSNVALECNESSTSMDQLKAPMCPGLQSAPGTPKGKRELANNCTNQISNSKTVKNSGKKKGLNVELNSLPIISNMSVTLDNCALDGSLTVEMPKLEAEGIIDKKNDKNKKSNNCKVDKNPSKLKTTRPIAPAPAPAPTPPQLIAIPSAAFTNTTTGTIPGLPSLTTAVGQATPKSPPLKPIQPKPTIMGEPSSVNPSLTSLKDKKKKEKRKLKEKESKEALSPQEECKVCKVEDLKGSAKDLSGNFLKEHINKSESLINGLMDSPESRMASIKAEADKVYTFTDNAPSPSIGSASRVECSTVINGQSTISPLNVLTQNGGDSSTTKTNSPAYSDISDAADDGGFDSRSEGMRSKTSSPTDILCNKDNVIKGHSTPVSQSPQVKESHSPYYHGYDPYYSPSYVHSGQANTPVNGNTTQEGKRKKESEEEIEKKEKSESLDAKKVEASTNNLPPQHQSVITQRHPALAQSLYYGQYAYGLYMDQKSLIASNPAYRQQYEKYYEDQRMAEQKITQTGRECERKPENSPKELVKEDLKLKNIPSATISKAPSTPEHTKINSKMAIPNTMEEPVKTQILPNHQQVQCDSFKAKQMENHQLIKEAVEMKSVMDSMKQTGVDPTVRFKQETDSRSWHHYIYQSKYLEQQKAEEIEREKKIKEENIKTAHKETVIPVPLQVTKEETKEVKRQDTQLVEDNKNKNDDRKTPVNWKDSRNARVAVSSPMSQQHQSYIQYLHAYPYTQMYDPNHPAYRAVSPVLMHGYPGAYLSPGFPHYNVYGKVSGRDEPDKARTSPSINSKSSSESKALDLLQQHANQYRTKSPALAEKASTERERESERERDQHSPFSQRHLHTHHHTHVGMGYPLIPGQYDPFQGLTSATLVATQQVAAQASASGMFPTQRRE